MVNGVEPFSKIDLYLVTHNHGDHFYAPYVNDFLKHHSETYFVSSNEVCDQFKNEDKLKSQVKPVSLDVGECADSVINGLPLKIIRLKHSGDETGTKIANYAYLINLNGIKIFHPGAITVEWDKSLLEKFNLGNEKIDIMFVAYFDLSDVTVKYINDVIKPKYIVAMHIPSNDFEVESKKFLKAFPKGIVLQNPMDKKVFAN
jgi:L-ascorbate metabolism protein UlaG (beta-lactamase superfamily)